jgi:DNA-binding IclR family transcriptional regulator
MYIQAVKNSKYISCTTEAVASLSDRANEALQEALLLTNQVCIMCIRQSTSTMFIDSNTAAQYLE